MLKKVSKIAVLLCLFTFAGNTFAQNEVAEYPQYGFWSNWGIGISGSFMAQPDAYQFNGIENPAFGSGFNAGLGIILQKEVDRGAYLRFRYVYPSLFWGCNNNDAATLARGTWGVAPIVKKNDDGTIKETLYQSMDQHSALTAEFLLSLNNSFHNWNPERRGNLYLFAGGGIAFSGNEARAMYRAGIQLDGGLGFSYKITDRSSIFCELESDVIADAPAFWKKKNDGTRVGFHHTDFLATVGYIFNFGVTAADQELLAQRALVTKEQMDALEEENDNLKKEVTVVKNDEQKLRDQINQLNEENERIRREALAKAQRVSDSLSGVLDQLKNDQLTYYAIPFSVLYPNDSWHVTDSEMIKVKAISRIMKDNPDVKLTIVGFCDYTASDEYNMKLSQKRAEEVKRIMVKKYGIDPDRLTVDWKGKTVAFGDIHYELNRRVSFYRVIE